MKGLILSFGVCSAAVLLGLALAPVSGPAGSIIAGAGFIGFAVLFVFVGLKNWRNNPGAYLTPGKGHREWREEYEKAAREKAARERSDSSH